MYAPTMHLCLQQLQKGAISPLELVERLYREIEIKDRQIQAWVRLTKEPALRRAQELTRNRRRYRHLPLYGIPYGAKDLFYTQNIKTCAGCKVYEHFIPDMNATVIQRLEEAGAILIGKTTMTELATQCCPPKTRNPWNLSHTPGGSSSGSAAAVAADMAFFSLGTQTRGSLLRPAAYNGLTSMKASFGRISRYGVIPCSMTLDHVGAITHSVADLVTVYNIISGSDAQDITTKRIPQMNLSVRKSTAYKIGILTGPFFNQTASVIVRKIGDALAEFAKMRFTLKNVQMPTCAETIVQAHDTIEHADFAAFNEQTYRDHPSLYSSGLRKLMDHYLKIKAVDYIQAQKSRIRLMRVLNDLFKEKDVDVLVCPTTPTLAPNGVEQTGSPLYNIPFTNAGVPALTIPVGFDEETGLPVGMQLISPLYEEQKAIDVAYMFQLVTHWHRRRPACLS
ncbi:MAG: amidase [Sporolactobacillus sp.]|jgi:Asp-tRNA(Asn)/Glu-tRNA(Gln) amidotransferase A subunit family amidase|nr:amidase [Sporolactobacillus sp.]